MITSVVNYSYFGKKTKPKAFPILEYTSEALP